MFPVMFSRDEYFVYILLSIQILLVADKVHIAVVRDASNTVIAQGGGGGHPFSEVGW